MFKVRPVLQHPAAQTTAQNKKVARKKLDFAFIATHAIRFSHNGGKRNADWFFHASLVPLSYLWLPRKPPVVSSSSLLEVKCKGEKDIWAPTIVVSPTLKIPCVCNYPPPLSSSSAPPPVGCAGFSRQVTTSCLEVHLFFVMGEKRLEKGHIWTEDEHM